MRDIDIRTKLKSTLVQAHADESDTLILDELQVCAHSARVDVAVVNGQLHGYEIKSEKDTLQRLPSQQLHYGTVFDRVTIVAGSKHLSKISTLVPAWWGLVEAVGGDAVSLHQRRPASTNANRCPYSISDLLWREEMLHALSDGGFDRGVRSKPRRALQERLVSVFSVDEIAALVRTRLKTRTNWRVDAERT